MGYLRKVVWQLLTCAVFRTKTTGALQMLYGLQIVAEFATTQGVEVEMTRARILREPHRTVPSSLIIICCLRIGTRDDKDIRLGIPRIEDVPITFVTCSLSLLLPLLLFSVVVVLRCCCFLLLFAAVVCCCCFLLSVVELLSVASVV